MIGVKYLRYHPKLIFELSSGLSIFQAMFDNANGGCGVIGGPHEEFTQTNQQFYKHHHNQSFFANIFSSVNGPDTLLGYKQFGCDVYESDNEEDNSTTFITRQHKLFEMSEITGTEINYRCVNCRQCKTCKNHDETCLLYTSPSPRDRG